MQPNSEPPWLRLISPERAASADLRVHVDMTKERLKAMPQHDTSAEWIRKLCPKRGRTIA
ncbi:hypothetical protein GCM10011363_29870 [Marivita lacus]|uniref:Uncharacterized protein n=1 Tax=Marivita lacus TaxID=1323742 RepID=A0ABQ1KUW8_9RHOB|nr:hypothetical protein GCM10011363_29870 [Marivita lacus]